MSLETPDRSEGISPRMTRIASGRRHQQPYVMPTGQQIRAARAMLRWTAAELARNAGVAWRTVQRAEAEDGVPPMHVATLQKIQRALEAGGIEFTSGGNGPGIRMRRRS